MPASEPARPGSSNPSRGKRAWAFQGLLVLLVAFLIFRAWQVRNLPFVQVDWGFQSPNDVVVWLRGLVSRELALFGLCFLLGLLTPAACGQLTLGGQRPLRWLVWLAWAAFGLATIALCFGIAWSTVPPVGALLLPFLSYLLGVHVSAAALRGARPFAWAAAQLGVLVLLLLAMTGVAIRMAVAPAPLEFDSGVVSAATHRQLAQRLWATRLPDDQPQHLQLADTEINALLITALGQGSVNRQARVQFFPSAFAVGASLPLPQGGAPGRFANLQAAGHLSIKDGRLNMDLRDLTLGRLAVPSLVLRMGSSGLYAMLMDDPQTRSIIQAIIKLELQTGTVALEFRPGALGGEVIPSLAHLLWAHPDVAFETRIYIRHLLAIFARMPREADRLGLMMQGAFELAVERSEDGDPILENRAALFALAILLGHPDLEPFVGDLLDPDQSTQARRMIGSVALRGRQDWARHFLVSAALVLLSNQSTSDRVGLLKEQLDSQIGGTGFSFADKLANLAGTRLATAAIRDQASARSVQARLAQGFDVDAFFPAADGLTEGISAADFQARYGGLDGPGYRQAQDELNRRLDALPPL